MRRTMNIHHGRYDGPLRYRPTVNIIANVNVHNDEFFERFPPGYRFCPLDEELIEYYLLRKVLNQTLPRNRIHVVEFYRFTPQQLSERYRLVREREWYFFTLRQKKYPKGKRPNRAVGGGGYWKPTGIDKPVFRSCSNDEGPIGSKRSLDFCTGNHPDGIKTEWKMHEYTLMPLPPNPASLASPSNNMQLDEWVLCKIYKVARTNKSKKDEEEKRDASGNDEMESNSHDSATPAPSTVDRDDEYLSYFAPTPPTTVDQHNNLDKYLNKWDDLSLADLSD